MKIRIRTKHKNNQRIKSRLYLIYSFLFIFIYFQDTYERKVIDLDKSANNCYYDARDVKWYRYFICRA